MKIYNYKTGKAVFVNNQKIEISDDIAKIIEANPIFPKEMYDNLGLEHKTFVQDSDETLLKLAENTTLENLSMQGKYNFNVNFYLYKGVPFWVDGECEGNHASVLRRFNLEQVYTEFKNTCK